MALGTAASILVCVRSNSYRHGITMRLPTTQDYSLPQPGTPEAIELGCTCRFIGHDAKLEEGGQVGMLIAPDANCPIHGSAAQLEEHD